jgi:hypothetical protein
MTAKMNMPRVLVLRCDECGKRVGRSGYIKVDRAALVVENVNGIGVLDIDNRRAFWQILHEECDTNPRWTDFKLPTNRFTTTGDFLEATGWLLRNQPELIVGSNWSGLISRVLCDTREYVDLLKQAKLLDKNTRRRLRYTRNGSDIVTAVSG